MEVGILKFIGLFLLFVMLGLKKFLGRGGINVEDEIVFVFFWFFGISNFFLSLRKRISIELKNVFIIVLGLLIVIFLV